jgi:hypothetical protein
MIGASIRSFRQNALDNPKFSQALSLREAYALVAEYAPSLTLGGITIAERHAHTLDEHERILAKAGSGCRFFVTQAVYDVTSTLSLLSDYGPSGETSAFTVSVSAGPASVRRESTEAEGAPPPRERLRSSTATAPRLMNGKQACRQARRGGGPVLSTPTN